MTSWTSHEHSLIQRLELLTARGANSRRLAGTPELCPEHNPGERRTPRTLTVRPRMSSSSHTQMTTSDIVSSDAETDQQTTPRWRREIRISTSWSFWFSRTRLEERPRQEKFKQLVCKTESCREVKVNMWVFLRRSGVSKHRQPLTPRQDCWRQPATHPHTPLFHSMCTGMQARLRRPGLHYRNYLCVHVCLQTHNGGSVWQACSSNENYAKEEQSQTQDSMTDRAEDKGHVAPAID